MGKNRRSFKVAQNAWQRYSSMQTAAKKKLEMHRYLPASRGRCTVAERLEQKMLQSQTLTLWFGIRSRGSRLAGSSKRRTSSRTILPRGWDIKAKWTPELHGVLSFPQTITILKIWNYLIQTIGYLKAEAIKFLLHRWIPMGCTLFKAPKPAHSSKVSRKDENFFRSKNLNIENIPYSPLWIGATQMFILPERKQSRKEVWVNLITITTVKTGGLPDSRSPPKRIMLNIMPK